MATQPDSPPEIPETNPPAEEPMQEPPEIEPMEPDFDDPSPGPDETPFPD